MIFRGVQGRIQVEHETWDIAPYHCDISKCPWFGSAINCKLHEVTSVVSSFNSRLIITLYVFFSSEDSPVFNFVLYRGGPIKLSSSSKR